MISKLGEEDWEVVLLPLDCGFVEHLEVLSLLSWQVLLVIFRSGIFLLLVVVTHFPLKICVQPCILDWNVNTASRSKPDGLLVREEENKSYKPDSEAQPRNWWNTFSGRCCSDPSSPIISVSFLYRSIKSPKCFPMTAALSFPTSLLLGFLTK